MRTVQNSQMQIGEVDVAQIKFNLKSRDDIPRILHGLQHVYMNVPLREAIFSLLEKRVAPTVNKQTCRPGMALWKILVCGVVRLDLNIDYDRLQELVNEHNTLRAMLGHAQFDEATYEVQTLKDNLRLLTPELLDEINQLIVNAGHVLVKKKEDEALRGRSDSFVVETNVHFPTDINLLWDAMRKVITLTAQLHEKQGKSDWRQYRYNLRHVKRLMRNAQNKKRAQGKSEKQKEENARQVVEAHQEYLAVATQYLNKAQATLAVLRQQGLTEADVCMLLEIESFMPHALRQMDQIRRRVIEGKIIDHAEKVFSIFEPHTEWISKGKAGVPVELGLRVAILEDQYQFILHHQVMEKQTDDSVAVSIVTEAKHRFGSLAAISFDKGFHSPENQRALKNLLEEVTLPRKGKLSKQAKSEEESPAFIKAKRAHSAVESAINALEVHGLDTCPDKGIIGFKRYIALAVVTRNIHRIGDILWKREQAREQRQQRKAQNALLYQQAA
jgi:IS5 family transposase